MAINLVEQQHQQQQQQQQKVYHQTNVKPLTVTVYLMDKNGIEMHINKEKLTDISCEDILEKMNLHLHRVRLTEQFCSEQQIQQIEHVFSIWMISPLLEIQLKPDHRPYCILQKWEETVRRFANIQDSDKKAEVCKGDTPVLVYQRNVYLTKEEEESIEDPVTLKLLFDEAKDNVLLEKYLMDEEQYCKLAALNLYNEENQAFNSQIHTTAYIANLLDNLLPAYLLNTNLLDFGFTKAKFTNKILAYYKSLPAAEMSKQKLYKDYLQICREQPFYGSAFFHGQIERAGFTAFISQNDIKVWIAINSTGLHIMEEKSTKMLLTLGHSQFCWEIALPCDPLNPNSLPCLFLQVKDEQGQASRLVQVFTRAVPFVESLLKHFAKLCSTDSVDSKSISSASSVGSYLTNCSTLTLKRFACAKLNDKGQCIKKKGSFNFSKNNNSNNIKSSA